MKNGKQSVASMWGEMVKAATAGEVVEIASPRDPETVVAVMISKTEYDRLEREAEHEWCHLSAEEL